MQTWHERYSRRYVPKLLLKAVVPCGLVVVRPQYKEKLLPVLRWALRNKRFVFIRNASVFPKIALGEQEKDILRRQYLRTQKRLILFLGFVYPHKGVELLFEIADPALDQIVIAGKIMDEDGDYHKEIMRRALAGPWLGKVTITGFLPTADVAALLAVTDAVVLPFRDGGGEWNTSIHAAVLQGAFVITTSVMEKGYDVKKDYKKAYDDWKKSDDYLQRYKAWERERDSIVNDNALIYIAFSDSIAGFDKEDMFELLNHFKNEKLIIDSKNLDFNTGFKVDFNKLKSNNKKLRFKPVSSFPEGSEIWNDKYDLAGVLSFSRILFDKTKSYGVLNAGFMKGRLNGGGLRIFIKKDKKGTWIIDEIKETWIS